MNYLEKLQDFFPNHVATTLQTVINDVENELSLSGDEEKFERMCTLLIENYSNLSETFTNGDVDSDDDDYNEVDVLREQLARRFPDACPKYIDDYLNRDLVRMEYASIAQQFQMNGYKKKGGNTVANSRENTELVMQMKVLFPDACEKYINQCVKGGLNLDGLIDQFSVSYVKATAASTSSSLLQTLHLRLCEMLPKFDPDFLLTEAKKLPTLTEAAFSNCVAGLLEMETYPTIAAYNKRQMNKQKMLNYLFQFKIDTFLKEFSNNLKCFENIKRKHSLQAGGVDSTELENNRRFACVILCSIYSNVQSAIIEAKLKQCQYDILQCCRSLGTPHRKDLVEREVELPANSYTNKLMFQELAYVIYRTLINNYLQIRTDSYQKAYKDAEAANQLRTCKTCFEEGLLLMPEECYQCINGCVFCKQCMIRGCEVAYGDGLLEIDCFEACGATFGDNILQMVMDPIAFCKLMDRKRIKAIREANLSDFETCPSCDYGTIVANDDKIFFCKNPDCGKETCLECRHDAHIPLRCNEIEYDEDVQRRTYIENKMAEALIRVCKKCNRQIIKETGCNKMTCVCGQTMCYVCGESGINYNHFGARCPQQSNQEDLHRNNVLMGIQAAKAHLGVDKNPNKLKFDPSKGF